jgi:hypothetical protein
LVGKLEGKKSQGRPRHKWEGDIKMVLKALGWGNAGWIHLAQDRDLWQALVTTIMNLWVS